MVQNSYETNLERISSFNICVIGAGYVGLVAAACFSKLGNKTICIDNDREKINFLQNKKIPNFEPGLEEIVAQGIKKNTLSFATGISEGVKNSDIIFIAVNTPSKENGEADLSAVDNVGKEIAKHLKSYKLIVQKSTVPVQTGARLEKIIKNNLRNKVDFDIASNPEFLREGRAVKDFLYPDRIVLGVDSEKAEKILRRLYRGIKTDIVVTDINTAELIKHACNSFLATKLSFINALANICEKTQADIDKVAFGMGLDKRIGPKFLKAGLGFGGSCFPKDINAFIQIAENNGIDFKLLKEARNINLSQREHFFNKIKKELVVLKGKIIGILGLSFKPDTDDLRGSPIMDIIPRLMIEGACVKVYDPKAMDKAKLFLKGAVFCEDAYQVANDAECLALATEWQEFKDLDFSRIKNSMKFPFIADGRNCLNKKDLIKIGFRYTGVGK